MLESFLRSEMVQGWLISICFVLIGIILSSLFRKIDKYVKGTPNKVDDAIFNFLVNDIFLKVEKNKIDEFGAKNGVNLKNLNKLTQAINIFKICYKEETGLNADEKLINKAKAIWSELAVKNTVKKGE